MSFTSRRVLVLIISFFSFSAAAEEDKPIDLWQYEVPTPLGNDAKKFSGSLEAGDQVSNGAVEFTSASGALNLKYDMGNAEAAENASYTFFKDGDDIVTNRTKSYTGFDHYLFFRTWILVLNEFERNEPAKLSYSNLTGGGFKFDLLRNNFWKLSIGAALLDGEQKSVREGYEDHDRVMSYRLKFGLKYAGFGYNLVSFYQPSVLDKTYRWMVDTGVSLAITEKFSFKSGYLFRYDSEPFDPEIKKWEREHYARLAWEF